MKNILSFVAVLLLCGSSYGQKLSSLPTTTALASGDKILVLQLSSGTDKTILQSDLFGGTTPISAVTATALVATTFNLNGGATPSVTAFGDFSSDNNLWGTGRGAPVFFDGTSATALVNVLVSDTPLDKQVPTWNTGGTITWETPLGALTSTQVAYGSAGSVITSEAAFAYNATTNVLAVGGISLGAGSEVSSIGPLVDSVDGTSPINKIYQTVASGTAYTLTATSAAVAFGTTSPTIVFANAGTYWVSADVQFSYVGSTFAANRQFDLKLRRTNNTAADVTGSAFSEFIPTLTTITDAGPHSHIGPFLYTTATTTDSVTVFADVSVLPTAGTVTVSACTIVAMRAF